MVVEGLVLLGLGDAQVVCCCGRTDIEALAVDRFEDVHYFRYDGSLDLDTAVDDDIESLVVEPVDEAVMEEAYYTATGTDSLVADNNCLGMEIWFAVVSIGHSQLYTMHHLQGSF